jgi:UDP-N-acetylmuramate--alanine ligase
MSGIAEVLMFRGRMGIAEVLNNLGYKVQGSDQSESANVQRLRDKGIEVHIGHSAANLGDAEVVVVSTAIKKNNPELMAARERFLPVVRRAEMLAELMRFRNAIAIGGTHGKTTTTSMVATLLEAGGLDPTVINGGIINAYGTNARMGEGEWMVVEADESDGTFLKLPADIAVITNIDPEHLDHYGTYGLVIACLDHPHVQAILPRIEKRTATYGLSAQADYRAKDPRVSGLDSHFELVRRGESLGEVTVRLPGIHNVLNTLAVLAIADELQVPLDEVKASLAAFEGVQRRFTLLGERAGVTVVDDYGHHPAEVQVTLEAAQRAFGRRLVVAFQPHRYTRTHHLFEDLTQAFNRADVLLLTDVYAAGEEPIEGATSDALARSIRAHGHRDVHHIGPRQELLPALLERIHEGDVVLTLGAGDITQVGPALLEALEARGS